MTVKMRPRLLLSIYSLHTLLDLTSLHLVAHVFNMLHTQNSYTLIHLTVVVHTVTSTTIGEGHVRFTIYPSVLDQGLFGHKRN